MPRQQNTAKTPPVAATLCEILFLGHVSKVNMHFHLLTKRRQTRLYLALQGSRWSLSDDVNSLS